MKLVFDNYDIGMSTYDRFIEGETITLLVYENIRLDDEKFIRRKVRFDNEAGDLYVVFKRKKYFYSEFK
ncbi:MAG: hypothetical protein ACI4VL_02340 [Bacilli bacterium]